MKKSIVLFLTIICVLFLTACNTKSMNYIIENKPSVTGIVEEVHDDYIIMYSETAAGYPNETRWQISLEVKNKDSYTDITVGDEIVVYYDGMAAETSPLQVGTVYAITLKTPTKRTVDEESGVDNSKVEVVNLKEFGNPKAVLDNVPLVSNVEVKKSNEDELQIEFALENVGVCTFVASERKNLSLPNETFIDSTKIKWTAQTADDEYIFPYMKVNETGDIFMIDWTYKEFHFAIYGKSPKNTSDRDMAGKIALEIIRNLGADTTNIKIDYGTSSIYTKAEMDANVDWCIKMLARVKRYDAEGMFRWHWVLIDSLEIFCDIKQHTYWGPKKALKWMEKNHPSAFVCYKNALDNFSINSLENWIAYIKNANGTT